MVYWNGYDIALGVIGGLLIGVATSIHYLLKGRVTGFSGIVYSIITFDKPSFYWKVSLMMGVVIASSIFFLIYGWDDPIIEGASTAFDPIPILTRIGWGGAPIAGFFVGFGTKMGNGCTSGHGVCGLPRLSIRSWVATGCFMGMGLLTASIKENFIPLERPEEVNIDYLAAPVAVIVIAVALICLMAVLQYREKPEMLQDLAIATLTGFVFGLGLTISGMVKRTKIIGFLCINENWDPTLMFVVGCSVGVNFITFRLKEKPFFNTKYEVPTNKNIDWKLVLGASLFGFGWGIGGFCPGPAMALFPQFTIHINILFMGCLFIGQLSANYVVKWTENRKQQSSIEPIKQNEDNKQYQQIKPIDDKQEIAIKEDDHQVPSPPNNN